MRKKFEITEKEVARFAGYLRQEEREDSTIESYLRAARRFATWLDGRVVTKELAATWKTQLLEQGYRPVSVNAMLAAVNKLFVCMGRKDCKVRYLKLQRQMFRKSERGLTRAEYQRLLDAARARGDIRLLLLLETLCATGIRVSELQYITVEAARNGVVEIALKGKIRTILLPTKLCRKLLKYAKKCGIVHGQIFLTKKGTGLSRKFIWAEMKKLCEAAKVARSKVFPHNLREFPEVKETTKNSRLHYFQYENQRFIGGIIMAQNFTYMTMYASGSAQPQLPIKDMKRMKIIKPDAKTMERFTEMSADIYNQISLLIMKNQTLAKQRDMLLSRLMSGKLEV